MLASAMHLLRVTPTMRGRIHPNGESGKQFAFPGWLLRWGLEMKSATDKNAYGRTYLDVAGCTIFVNPKTGRVKLSPKLSGGL